MNSNYTLNRDGPCHRTQVAIRLHTLEVDEWHQFVTGRAASAEDAEKLRRADSYLADKILKPYYKEAVRTLNILQSQNPEQLGISNSALRAIRRRWAQAMKLTRAASTSGLKGIIKHDMMEFLEREDMKLCAVRTRTD